MQNYRVGHLLLIGGLVTATVGCPGGVPETNRASSEGRSAQRRASQANVLLRSIAAQLRGLPEAAQLELTPPTVLLDSRSSGDGEDLEAVLTRPPNTPPGAPANVLTVPRGNARFRSAGVKSGDTIKYFVIPDRDTMDRIRESGEADIVTFTAANLEVAQVLGNDSLLVVGGLPQEISFPAKIEVWRNIDDRMVEIDRRLGRYTDYRDPPRAWQPSPDEAALEQMTERLNQWLRQRTPRQPSAAVDEPTDAWDANAALGTLPAELLDDERLLPRLGPEEIAKNAYDEADARAIEGAVWLRDVGAWARGEATGAADQAARLFDWSVRNVQLVAPEDRAPHAVWELLLHGRGTATQRAWVFAEMCRGQRIPAVVLLTPSASEGERPLVGVADGDAVLVFDPGLGLPIPAADGEAIATLADLSRDESLARALDLQGAPYPHTEADFAAARPAIVADLFSLTDRAAALEGALRGADAFELSIDAAEESRRWASLLPDREVVLWAPPLRTLRDQLAAEPATRRREVKRFLPYAWRPALWKARALHFRGRKAKADPSRDALADDVDDHRAAQRLYMSPRVRPTNKALRGVTSELKREIYRAAKNSATLWMGVLAYDRGDYRNSVDWLARALADESIQDRHGAARYNLARAHEALGEAERAAELLEQDDSPQRHGNRLRARRLRERGEAEEQGEAP